MGYTVTKACDSASAFRFNSDTQARIGHITKLTIGSEDVKADMSLRDPLNPSDSSKKIKVVGAIDTFTWNLEITGALQFSAQVSDDTKSKLLEMLLKGIKDITIKVTFTIYDYDTRKAKYFKSGHTDDKEMEGSIKLNGSERMIAVADDRSSAVEEPRNFRFELFVTPARKAQTINFAVSEGGNIAKQWGSPQGE